MATITMKQARARIAEKIARGELPEALQMTIEELQAFINTQATIEQCRAAKPSPRDA